MLGRYPWLLAYLYLLYDPARLKINEDFTVVIIFTTEWLNEGKSHGQSIKI